MKRLFMAIAALWLGCCAAWSYQVVVRLVDGTTQAYSSEEIASVVLNSDGQVNINFTDNSVAVVAASAFQALVINDQSGAHPTVTAPEARSWAFAADGSLMAGSQALSVYSLDGRAVCSLAPGQSAQLRGWAPGVYVIKTDTATEKILLK